MTTPATTTDPFTEIYDAIWSLLEGNDRFCDLVALGNRVKFSGDDDPRIKVEKLLPSDAPEVRVVAGAINPHLFRTSNGSSIKRTFRVEIYTDKLTQTAGIFPVEWSIIQAVTGGKDKLAGLDHVKTLRFVNERDPGLDPTRRSRGWYSVLAVEVESWFRTDYIPVR